MFSWFSAHSFISQFLPVTAVFLYKKIIVELDCRYSLYFSFSLFFCLFRIVCRICQYIFVYVLPIFRPYGKFFLIFVKIHCYSDYSISRRCLTEAMFLEEEDFILKGGTPTPINKNPHVPKCKI